MRKAAPASSNLNDGYRAGHEVAALQRRDFVPWRFSDAGRHSSWIASSCRHPKTCTIGEAVIILTRSLKQFRLDKIEVCCGPQKLVCAMMLQGCRKADRAEVVEREHFATPNYLKSHGERNLLSPFGNTCAITPKLCMPSGPIRPSKNYPALKSPPPRLTSPPATAGAPLPATSCLGAFRTPAATARG